MDSVQINQASLFASVEIRKVASNQHLVVMLSLGVWTGIFATTIHTLVVLDTNNLFRKQMVSSVVI